MLQVVGMCVLHYIMAPSNIRTTLSNCEGIFCPRAHFPLTYCLNQVSLRPIKFWFAAWWRLWQPRKGLNHLEGITVRRDGLIGFFTLNISPLLLPSRLHNSSEGAVCEMYLGPLENRHMFFLMITTVKVCIVKSCLLWPALTGLIKRRWWCIGVKWVKIH